MTGGNIVVPTGTANLASVLAAFRRLGMALEVADSPAAVTGARRVVLPGVGTFGAAMRRLEELELVTPLRQRVSAGLPTLAICVGMQILARSSEESPDASGLEAVAAEVKRFDDELIVPQLAWGQVVPSPESKYVEPGWAYFANSYRVPETPTGWVGSTATYGKPFVAALERGSVLACQFHPELSGPWGTAILGRWLSETARAS